MRLVDILVTLSVFSLTVSAQKNRNKKNRKNKINWNKRNEDNPAVDLDIDQLDIEKLKQIAVENSELASKVEDKKSIVSLTDQINDRLKEMKTKTDDTESDKHRENINRLSQQFNGINALTSEYTPLDLERKVVQETIQGNITMNAIRETIVRARSHAQDFENIFSVEFLDIFEQMAEDQIFNQKRRVAGNDAERMLMTRSSSPSCRNGGPGCTSYFDIDAIWGYGCYCLFGADWRKAHGKPVNEVDSICQKLHHCYKCARIDGAEEDSTCDPAFESYAAPVVKDIDNQGIWVSCETGPNAGDNCKIRSCCCDIMFAQGLLDIFFSGVVFDPTLKHELGWDFEGNCPRPTCNDPSGYCPAPVKECCGAYPERFPFAPKNGARGCCVNKTYNTLMLECCDNGVTKKVGEC